MSQAGSSHASLASEPVTGGTPGKFLRRLEALENLVRDVKQKNTLLQMRLDAIEKWKETAEQWLFENFEVKFDLSMQFQVAKVEVKTDLQDSLDGSSMETDEAQLPPSPIQHQVDNNSSLRTSVLKSRLSQDSNVSTSTPKNSFISASVVPTSNPNNLIETPNGDMNRPSGSSRRESSDDEVKIVEQDTSDGDGDHPISIRSVRSLFDSDVEIEEGSINLGTSADANSPYKSFSRKSSGAETTRVVNSNSNSTPKAPVVELLDEEEQLGEPSTTRLPSRINQNISITLEKSVDSGTLSSSPQKKNSELNKNTPVKRTETQTAFVAPSRMNSSMNGNATVADCDTTRSHMNSSMDRSMNGNCTVDCDTTNTTTPTFNRPAINGSVKPRPRSTVTMFKTSTGLKSSPYKGKAMVKPHRRKSTQSVYGVSSPRIVSTSNDIDDGTDDTPCDVCLGVDPELGNEMVFCDSCNVCVHQACYGVKPIPEGKWLCNPCKEGKNPKAIQCRFCPAFGGALKQVMSPSKNTWGHVSCALWIPEIKLQSKHTMEPIMNIHRIPKDRWGLRCQLCNEKKGACIQCQFNRKCVRAFHVTCAMKHNLEMKGTVDDDLNDGCELKAYCKVHSFGGQDKDKKRKKPRKRQSQVKSPNKKPRLDPETDTVT